MRTAFLVVEIYAAFVVVVVLLCAAALVRDEIREHLDTRRDRRRWELIDEEATAFRSELDDATIDAWVRGAA